MIELSASSTTTTLTVTGDLDLAERTTFAATTAQVAALGRRALVVDLCGATYVDSAGAAFLVALAREAHGRGGSAVLRGGSEQAVFVLEVCGAGDHLAVDHDHVHCASGAGRRPWGSTCA